MSYKKKLDIDDICEMVLVGTNLRDIAKHYDSPLSTLHDYLSQNPNRCEKYQLALTLSAEILLAKAEDALRDIQRTATPADIARQKGLSDLFKWASSKRNPTYFGDRQQSDVTVTKKVIKVIEEEDLPHNSKILPLTGTD